MTVHKENLVSALSVAIEKQREVEKKAGYTRDSALVAGWVDTKQALERDEELEFY